MTTTAADLPPAPPPDARQAESVASCVLDAKITSETGVFNCEHAGFWFPEWQEGEREVDEEIAAGRTLRFSSLEDYLDSLEDDED